VRKSTPDSFLHTNLEEILREHSVTDLIICGMHTEFCVDTTTRRAPREVIQHHNATLTNISSFGTRARAVSSEALQIGG
jgi:nicotinamidase-related amidase